MDKCFNDRLEEIKRKKNKNCCNYVPFAIPPGSPGPPGPATIEIGTVTTGLPDTDVDFPQDGPNSGSISRTRTSYIYLVCFFLRQL